MAVTALALTQLSLGVASANLTDAAGGSVATTPTDGWAIDMGAKQVPENVLLKFVADAAGESLITITAGAKPPAERAGLGALTFALGVNEVKYIVVEGARHLLANGTVVATCIDSGTRCIAFAMPAGLNAGTALA